MKIRAVFAILLIIGMVLGCLGDKPKDDSVKIDADQEFEEYLTKYKQQRVFRGNTSLPDRENYGISMRVFEELPEVPSDFLYTVYLIKAGKFFDINSLSENYWKQPEFDPEFTRQGLKYWTSWHDPKFRKSHWSTMGVRSYPYNQYVNSVPGDSFNITLFFSSDWNVETYQGMRISPAWLSDATTQEGKIVSASPDAEKYINVNITPNQFLLSPAFPMFTKEWIKELSFTGKIADDTPPGLYVLSMDILDPDQDKSDEWFLEHLNLYSEGAQMIKLDKPYLQAFITVSADEQEM